MCSNAYISQTDFLFAWRILYICSVKNDRRGTFFDCFTVFGNSNTFETLKT